jgi:hypothetical protein
MKDAHLKIPKNFLLDGCMYLNYQILSLDYLFSGERIWRNLFLNFNFRKLTLKRPCHIFSQYTWFLAQLAFVPFPVASSFSSFSPQVYHPNFSKAAGTRDVDVKPQVGRTSRFLSQSPTWKKLKLRIAADAWLKIAGDLDI